MQFSLQRGQQKEHWDNYLLIGAVKGAGWPDIFVCWIFIENKHLYK